MTTAAAIGIAGVILLVVLVIESGSRQMADDIARGFAGMVAVPMLAARQAAVERRKARVLLTFKWSTALLAALVVALLWLLATEPSPRAERAHGAYGDASGMARARVGP